MIKIEAASRLKVTAAKADPEQAIAFLKTLGIKRPKLVSNSHGGIRFKIDYASYDKAVHELTKQYGKETNSQSMPEGKVLTWRLPGSRSIDLGSSYSNDFSIVLHDNVAMYQR